MLNSKTIKIIAAISIAVLSGTTFAQRINEPEKQYSPATIISSSRYYEQDRLIIPQPVDGYRVLKDSIQYPAIAELARFEGNLVVRTYIDLDSTAKRCSVIARCASDSFCEAAIATISRLKWQPGSVNGTPQGMYIDIPVRFVIQP